MNNFQKLSVIVSTCQYLSVQYQYYKIDMELELEMMFNRIWILSEEATVVHLGISFAHFLARDLATPTVDASWSPGTAFQIITMILVDRVRQPGTGKPISLDGTDLVHCKLGFSRKRLCPRGSMNVFDFHTVTAVILATASFKHLRPAFCRRTSEWILSESLDFLKVRAGAFILFY